MEFLTSYDFNELSLQNNRSFQITNWSHLAPTLPKLFCTITSGLSKFSSSGPGPFLVPLKTIEFPASAYDTESKIQAHDFWKV